MIGFIERKYFRFYLKILNLLNANDVLVTKVRYRFKTGEKLRLDHPVDFMQKIQWLKLFKYTEDYGYLVDKYLVRDFVKNKIGENYLPPLLGVYEHVDNIEFDKLPNQFAIKVTHGSGYNIIVPDKTKLDVGKAKKKLRKFQNRNYYKKNRERIYKDLKPLIIVEKYLDQTEADHIIDYKFYCFDGKPESVWVKTFYQDKYRNCYYDLNWKRLKDDTNTEDYLPIEIERPQNLEEMIAIAKKLSEGFSFIRVDLYSIGEKVYFGELTFFPWGGMRRLTIESMNKNYGEKIILDQ